MYIGFVAVYITFATGFGQSSAFERSLLPSQRPLMVEELAALASVPLSDLNYLCSQVGRFTALGCRLTSRLTSHVMSCVASDNRDGSRRRGAHGDAKRLGRGRKTCPLQAVLVEPRIPPALAVGVSIEAIIAEGNIVNRWRKHCNGLGGRGFIRGPTIFSKKSFLGVDSVYKEGHGCRFTDVFQKLS